MLPASDCDVEYDTFNYLVQRRLISKDVFVCSLISSDTIVHGDFQTSSTLTRKRRVLDIKSECPEDMTKSLVKERLKKHIIQSQRPAVVEKPIAEDKGDNSTRKEMKQEDVLMSERNIPPPVYSSLGSRDTPGVSADMVEMKLMEGMQNLKEHWRCPLMSMYLIMPQKTDSDLIRGRKTSRELCIASMSLQNKSGRGPLPVALKDTSHAKKCSTWRCHRDLDCPSPNALSTSPMPTQRRK